MARGAAGDAPETTRRRVFHSPREGQRLPEAARCISVSLKPGKMGAVSSSEAIVPGPPGPGPPGAVGGQWGAFMVLLLLGLLVAYCCWGAPCCRGCCCRPRRSQATGPPSPPAQQQDSARTGQAEDILCTPCTPTIILLPQGRMLVVDGAVLSSLQADASGLDLIRLGENLVRAQRRQGLDSSILDAEAGLVGLAGLGLAGLKEGQGIRTLDGGPPTYDELFGFVNERSSPCPSPLSPRSPRSPLPLSGGASPASPSSSSQGASSVQQQPPRYEELVVDHKGSAMTPSTPSLWRPRSPATTPSSPGRTAERTPGGTPGPEEEPLVPSASSPHPEPSEPAAPAAPDETGRPEGSACATSQDDDQDIRESRV